VTEKELKMRYNIDVADYNVRKKAALKFLANGDKVKVSCQFRGREQDFQEIAVEMFVKLGQECSEVGKVESRPRAAGRTLIMLIAPLVTKAQVQSNRKREKIRQNKAAKASGAVTGDDDADDDVDDDDDEDDEIEDEDDEDYDDDDEDEDFIVAEKEEVEARRS
jgi:translation initiation factor IF-3